MVVMPPGLILPFKRSSPTFKFATNNHNYHYHHRRRRRQHPPPTSHFFQAFYNGWKKNHGVKAESLDLPDGIMMYLFGLCSLRHSDLNLLEWSNVNGKIAAAQQHLIVEGQPNVQGFAFGDSMYPKLSHIRPKSGAAQQDKPMNIARIAIEHHYGEAKQLFPFMSNPSKVKILSGMPLNKLYFSVMLLRNCYCCLYGNKTSKRFNCQPPELEEYLGWAWPVGFHYAD